MSARWTKEDLNRLMASTDFGIFPGRGVSKSYTSGAKIGTKIPKNGTKFPKSGKKFPKFKTSPSANALTRECLYLLNAAGYEAWRNNNAGVWDPAKKVFRKGSAKKGVSDIIGHHRKSGRAVYVEVKAAGDRLSKEQRQFLKDAKAAGCLAFEYRSGADLEKNLKIK